MEWKCKEEVEGMGRLVTASEEGTGMGCTGKRRNNLRDE